MFPDSHEKNKIKNKNMLDRIYLIKYNQVKHKVLRHKKSDIYYKGGLMYGFL